MGKAATRRVVAIQSGEAIFNMACSFQVLEDGLSHARTMPHVQTDDLPDERELIEARLDSLPEAMREMMQRERPIELKRVEAIDYANPKDAA